MSITSTTTTRDRGPLWPHRMGPSDQDNIYCAIIVAEPLRQFTQFIWWMQIERQMATNPQTMLTDLGCESATIHIHHRHWLLLLSLKADILILPSYWEWKAESLQDCDRDKISLCTCTVVWSAVFQLQQKLYLLVVCMYSNACTLKHSALYTLCFKKWRHLTINSSVKSEQR